jgi:hypothetical protein
MQYGSEAMLIGGFGGGVPWSVTTPVMALAVFGSIGLVTGADAAGVGADASTQAGPPQAAPSMAANQAAHARTRIIGCIEDPATFNFMTRRLRP